MGEQRKQGAEARPKTSDIDAPPDYADGRGDGVVVGHAAAKYAAPVPNVTPPSQSPMLTRSNRRDGFATPRLLPGRLVPVQASFSAITGTSAGLRLAVEHSVFTIRLSLIGAVHKPVVI
jgi:hypothetical protein